MHCKDKEHVWQYTYHQQKLVQSVAVYPLLLSF